MKILLRSFLISWLIIKTALTAIGTYTAIHWLSGNVLLFQGAEKLFVFRLLPVILGITALFTGLVEYDGLVKKIAKQGDAHQ